MSGLGVHLADDALEPIAVRAAAIVLEQLQSSRRSPSTIRFDAADGAYALLGVQPDGSVGLRVYNCGGALVHSLTAGGVQGQLALQLGAPEGDRGVASLAGGAIPASAPSSRAVTNRDLAGPAA
jgi:hypothetical protein